jgi:TatD DNase family protein
VTVPAVDMHCHLDLYPDPHAQVDAIARQKAYVLSVTTTPRAWSGTAALAAGHPRIKTALGLHPQLAAERRDELRLFDQLLPQTRYVGEVGLDGGRECRPFLAEQITIFDHILEACRSQGGRILSVHSRNAATPVLDALARNPGYGVSVLHWFSGTTRELTRAIEMGCWFSVGSAMVQGKKGRDLVTRMPRNRVLTETDGPFGEVKGQPLLPASCDFALAVLAESWGLDHVAVETEVLSSFRTLVSSVG